MLRLFITAALTGLLYTGMMLSPAAALAKLKVVATVPDLAAVAREVGGPEVEVSSLAVSTQDPHFVDARPHLVLRLNRADMLILTGLDLETGWLPTLLTGARNGRVQPGAPGYFNASTVVPLKQVPQQRIDRSMGDIHPGGNPHYMTDPRNGALVGLAIAERLGALDPAHRNDFRARARALQAGAQQLAKEQAKRFAALAAKQRQVVVYHQSLIYLLDWLGLEQVNTIEPKPGIPPSPGHVAALLGQMRQRGVEVVVQEEFFPTTAGKLLAEKTGARLVVLPGGPDFDGNQSYLSYIRTSADRLFEGFKR